jgi:hypothetical protein
MDSSPWLRSLVLLVQACLLSSCASSVHAVLHPQPEELPKLALVIQSALDFTAVGGAIEWLDAPLCLGD